MKVKDLIAQLQEANPEAIVIVSRDAEGNDFSPLAEVCYGNDNYDDGDVGLDHLTPELEKQGCTEDDLIEGEEAVVLWRV